MRTVLCISKLCFVNYALYIYAMHCTCYIRNVVPCGIGQRVMSSRAEELYGFIDGMMIDGYIHSTPY